MGPSFLDFLCQLQLFLEKRCFDIKCIFFPKSISEFSNEEFQDICEGFSIKQIQKDKVHILISLRADQGSMDRDMERSEKIISAIKQNGFITFFSQNRSHSQFSHM